MICSMLVACQRQLFFKPLSNRHHRRILFAQALRELDHERLRNFFAFAEAFGDQRHERRRLARGEFE